MNVRALTLTLAVVLLGATIGVKAAAADPPAARQSTAAAPRSGEQIYRAACAACHGRDGTGNPQSRVGFDTPLPDFTDCSFATPEAEADWFAIVHEGGPVRAFDRRMPSFAGALSDDEILRAVRYVRGLCGDRRWPPGDLNLPRALVTEKAYPENEALLVVDASRSGAASVNPSVVYERRLGRRSQWELVLPVALQQSTGGGSWTQGLGDVAAAFKHVLFHDGGRGSIVSLGSEFVFPTGRRSTGAGSGTFVVEPFLSVGQSIGANGFLQAQGGAEFPADTDKASREAFLRLASGRTFFEGGFHREWTPMLELIAARPFTVGGAMEWDLVPQLQLSLSRRHHVLVNAGVQVPFANRDGRGRTFRAYLLWDWFDGGFFSGW